MDEASTRLILSNWTNPNLLKGELFDTVILDYLLGATELFSPHFSNHLLPRIKPCVKKHLYLTGFEPQGARPKSELEKFFLRTIRLRDSVFTFVRGRSYFEFPCEWVCQHLQAHGFVVERVRHFQYFIDREWVELQLSAAREQLELVPENPMVKPFRELLDSYEEKVPSAESFFWEPAAFQYLVKASIS